MWKPNEKVTEIYAQIREAAGMDSFTLDGQNVYFNVKEMNTDTPRYQINVSVPGQRRDRIYRTKVKDGSFDLAGVVSDLKLAANIRRQQQETEATKNANREAASAIRAKYNLRKTYVSAYASSGNTFCAPSASEGMVQVQINFGAVTPEMADKIMAFAQSLENEV